MSNRIRLLWNSLGGAIGIPDTYKLLRHSCLVQRSFHVASSLNKELHHGKEKIRVGRDTTTATNIDLAAESVAPSKGMFPDESTPHQLFNGIPYADLPIINMKATKNNTILNLTDAKGNVEMLHSSGIEGFKGCKRGTGSAAQQAAITFATRARKLGMQTVRLRIQGFGLGRMNGILGLTMGGVQIVSITDTTKISPNPPRPRGARRL